MRKSTWMVLLIVLSLSVALSPSALAAKDRQQPTPLVKPVVSSRVETERSSSSLSKVVFVVRVQWLRWLSIPVEPVKLPTPQVPDTDGSVKSQGEQSKNWRFMTDVAFDNGGVSVER